MQRGCQQCGRHPFAANVAYRHPKVSVVHLKIIDIIAAYTARRAPVAEVIQSRDHRARRGKYPLLHIERCIQLRIEFQAWYRCHQDNLAS